MKKINQTAMLILVACMAMLVNVTHAQENKTVITIENEKVTDKEFLRMYNKNNVSDVSLKTTLDEYLDLYINYKLKVLEARNLKYDTIKKLREELKGYRSQLAKPYLIDEDVNKELLKEAYDRMLYDVNASHILIRTLPTSPAKDTLVAYEKAMEIRKQLLDGKSFEELAVEYSEDPSAKDRVMKGKVIKGNKGLLGYFTVFDMVYPFESAAYKLNVGEVSMPVRSNFGYHIIKLNEKKRAIGDVKVAHIMKFLNNAKTKEDSIAVKDSMMEVYQKLQNGGDFKELAKSDSDDKTTAQNGGELPMLKATRLLPKFVQNISKLKEGEYSAPFETKYGWHIIKLIEKKGVGTFEDKKDEIKKQIAKSDRASESVISLVKKIKAENDTKVYLDRALELKNVIDKELHTGEWKADTAVNMTKVVYQIGNNSYTQYDFAKFIEANPPTQKSEDLETLLEVIFESFVDAKSLEYEDENLPNKYPEFKTLMQEYEDGILLFELTNDEVWQKAVKDTLGLEKFYNKNKEKYNWKQRVKAKIFILLNDEITDKAKKLAQEGYSKEKLLTQLNDSIHTNVIIKEGLYENDANYYIEKVEWKKGLSDIKNYRKQNYFVFIEDFVEPQPKTLKEAKGVVTSDYQNYLEKQWIEKLRSKYNYKVDKEVFKNLKP